MGDVEHDFPRIDLETFEASGQPGAARGLVDHRSARGLTGQQRHRLDRHCHIHRRHGRLPEWACPGIGIAEPPAVGTLLQIEIPIDSMHRHIQRRRTPSDGFGRPRIATHQRYPASQYPGFFGPDGLAIVAEVVHVVQADAGYHGNVRVHDVHRVEAPAQPHFENRDVHARGLERHQRRQDGIFEVRQRYLATHTLDRAHRGADGRVVQGFGRDAKPFVELRQVR